MVPHHTPRAVVDACPRPVRASQPSDARPPYAPSVRETLAQLRPAGSPIASPWGWRPGLCLVCRRPTTPDGRVVVLDHRRQDALVSGLCRLDGCRVLAVALLSTWTVEDVQREVTFRPAA